MIFWPNFVALHIFVHIVSRISNASTYLDEGRGFGPPVVRLLLLAFLGVVAYHLVLLFVLTWTGHAVDWRFALMRVVGPSVLLNVVLAPFVWQPLAWLERKTRQERFAL